MITGTLLVVNSRRRPEDRTQMPVSELTMKDVIAITSTVYALATCLWGYSLQFRQLRATTPNAAVPVLPFVLATSLFVSFAGWGFYPELPLWAYPVMFIATLFCAGYLIVIMPAYPSCAGRVDHRRRPGRRVQG